MHLSFLAQLRSSALNPHPHPGAQGLFAALDGYLRSAKVRFREVFDGCDKGQKGYLDIQGLAVLLQTVMPNVTKGEVYYFQARAMATIYQCFNS